MFQIFGRPAKKGTRRLQIGFVTNDASMGGQIKEFIATREGVDLKLIKGSEVARQNETRDVNVFVYDLDVTSDGAMMDFDRFMQERPAHIPVVVMSPAVNDELVRWFLRLRVADWVKSPLRPGELLATCGRAISQSSGGRQTVKCLTFIGARGGVGATTLALHAAVLLGRVAAPEVTTCLVDLDLMSGSCADYLDVKANWQLDEIIANPTRLDSHMLDTMTATHATGVAVISAHRKFGDHFAFPAEVVTRTLDIASQKYSALVIDLPRSFEAWSEGVLLGSSDVFLVTDFSVPGLKSARRMALEIREVFNGEVQPKVIVNKFSQSFFAASLSGKEAKEILGNDLAGFVGAQDALVREAIDRGVPTTAIKARNAVVSDLAKIIGV